MTKEPEWAYTIDKGSDCGLKQTKHRTLRILITVFLLLCIPLGVFAVKNGLLPTSATGGYYSVTENRMDFSLDKTDFVLTKTESGSQTYLLSATLSLRKCEPDLYACIDNIELTGTNYNYMVFTAAASNGSELTPEALILRDDGEMTWTLEISLDAAAKTQFTPELTIEYTSGLTYDTADSHLLSIPLNITVK